MLGILHDYLIKLVAQKETPTTILKNFVNNRGVIFAVSVVK